MGEDPSQQTTIDYYSDVLCVWAWIAQPRLEELEKQWGTQVALRHRCVDIFGDAHRKISSKWGEQDGFLNFGKHIVEAAAPFELAVVNDRCWNSEKPHSSTPAHLVIKSAEIVAGAEAARDFALRVRRAFFVDAVDIGLVPRLLELAEEAGIEPGSLENALRDGRAAAGLSRDQRTANDHGVKGSPTWVLNEGTQILYGNVGYRNLSANNEELLKNPGNDASWC